MRWSRWLLGIAGIAGGVFAQPQAAYMIPDLGAPGMGVYVEIVARHDAGGTFGPDGVYLNTASDPIRIGCARPADTALLTVGPVVVSWNGRLASTVFFVHPWARPNSWRWSELASEFRIPIQVTVGGQSVVVDTFYIVQPTPIGVYTGPERVLGEGTLGVRSRRGAMVVDSLILPAGASFRVSTADCDPFVPGNQGYLPFVLMSLGSVRGGAGTTVSVSAEGIHGGPGGGGGGGSFCDAITSSARGSDGGSGFTSGGRGGRNGIGVVSSEYRNYGQSTGVNGESLNGVAPGTSPQYEAAGGGTGHPFGRSGEGCRDGYGCTPDGGYGGGSGYQQRQAGGAGGYATRGQSSGGNNGGYEHGNACLVPLAGGSGGASGNPQGVNVCSGSGGGGGGALRVVAPLIEGIRFVAEGAPGAVPGTSAAGPGGSGSGGAVHIAATLGYELPPLSVAGGRTSGVPSGGAGRVRVDGRELTPVTVQPPEATRYVGPSIAPVPPLPRMRARVSGTGNGQDVVLYLKPLSGEWRPVDTLVGYGVQWSTLLSLPEPDTLFFLVALQRIPNPSATLYAAEPEGVLSPAAATLLSVARLPKLSAPSRRTFDTLLCAGQERFDTVIVRNTGDGALTITSVGFAQGTQGFRLFAPPPTWFPVVVAPGDSLPLVVAFRAPASQGVFRDTLVILHTDTLTAGSPWRIAYEAVKDSVAFRLTDGAQPLRRLEFGLLCPGEERTATLVVQNVSGRPLRFAAPVLTNGAQWSVVPATAFSVPPGGQHVLTLQCRAGFIGVAEGMLIVRDAECGYADTVRLSAFGALTQLQWRGSGQFGAVRIGSSSELTLVLTNVGYSPARIEQPPVLAAPFQLVDVRPPLPVVLAPQQEIEFRVRYTPTAAQQDDAELTVVAVRADSACPDTARLLLSGVGILRAVQAVPSLLDFGVVSRCETVRDTVVLFNVGTVPVTLVSPAQIVGPEAQEFLIVVQPAVPRRLAPGDSALYIVQFLPGAGTGIRSAQLVVATEDTAEPFLTIGLRAERVAPFVAIPAAVDMGTLRLGQVAQASLTGRNLLLRPLTVQAVLSSHPDVSVTPQAVAIPAAGTYDFTVTLTPQRLGVVDAVLSFIVAEPCPDTHAVWLHAVVTGEGVTYTTVLDFGTLALCQERTDTLLLSNGTADTLRLLAASIVGPDAALFSITLPPLPVALAPGEQGRYAVSFRPAGSPDGPKQAQLLLTARAGPEPLLMEVLLLGRRETPLLSAPPSVSFGNVFVGAVAAQPLVVSNRGSIALQVEDARLQSGQAFRLRTVPPLPQAVAPTESLAFVVEFQPPAAGLYSDTLRIRVSSPCADERLIVLSGIGLVPRESRVWLPDTQATPWQRTIRIPVRYALNPPGAPSELYAAELEIAYEPSLFLVRGVTRGRVLRSSIGADGLAVIALRVDSVPAVPEGVLTELVGDVLLGSREESPLQLRSFLWDDGILSSRTLLSDGRLRLVGICYEGGPRLLRPVAAAQVRAVGEVGMLRIVTHGGERGSYALELYSAEGRLVHRQTWAEPEAGAHVRQWELTGLAAGVYLVLFRTPTESRSTVGIVLP